MIARFTLLLLLAIAVTAQTSPSPKSVSTYRIAGTVVSSMTGEPLSGVKVSISATENRELHQNAVTGPNGAFAFPDLAPGKYSLTASAYGYRPQGFNQHGDYFSGIAVGPGLDGQSQVFRLVPDAIIEGTVTDQDGEPVRNANVALFQRTNDTGRQRTQQAFNAVTDDRGHYQFAHRAPGTYFVAVSGRPWYAQYQGQSGNEAPRDPEAAARMAEEKAQLDVAYPMTFFPSAEDSSAASPIVLHPGERVTADVTMRTVPAVHLRVTTALPDDKNAPNAAHGFPRVSQRIFEGTIVPVMAAQAVSTNSATFEYTGIAPGRYIVEMPDPGLKRDGGGWYKEMDLSGTVDLDARESPVLASVTGTLILEGAVRSTAKIYVVLINRASGENFSTEVTDKGLFDFSDTQLRPGTYDVSLNNVPHLLVKDLAAKGALVTGQSINVSGGNVQLVVTATRAVVRIDGIVLRNEKPFAGAMVVLVPHDPGSNLTLFRRDQSDSDGTFSLFDVLPGAYTAIALQNAWDLDWASPAAVQPYLRNGTPIEVSGEGRLNVKVQLQ